MEAMLHSCIIRHVSTICKLDYISLQQLTHGNVHHIVQCAVGRTVL
jgi:hypothetical protein